MRHSGSKQLFEHWSSLRRGLYAPDRNDLDPCEIGAILQDVFILGLDPQGEWRYRVAGTRVTAFAKRELKDEPFQRWWRATDRDDARRLVAGNTHDTGPIIAGVSGVASDQTENDFELLLLPLRHGGRANLRMIGGFFPSIKTLGRPGLHIDELGLLSLRALLPSDRHAPVFGQEPPNMEVILERRRSFRLIKGGGPSQRL